MMKKNNRIKFCLIFLAGIIPGVLISNYTIVISFIRQTMENIVLQWPADFVIIEIPSSYDDKIQKAYFYRSKKNKAPLIVSLHSWSGDYKQYDPLSSLVIREDWNYIHPNFRGPNNSPEACMSEAVIQDIDDAIAYAINGNTVDESRIIVVGASGGGMATLGMYLRSSYNLYYCMAWAAITDLEAWYYQSIYAGSEHWKDILLSTGSGEILDIEETRKRSPLYMAPLQKTPGRLEIYAGINDGYTGTVSNIHSLLFYNKMAGYLGLNESVISDNDIIMLLSRSLKRYVNKYNDYIDNRQVLYKKSNEIIGIFIFDGSHEILINHAFKRIFEITTKY